MRGSDVVMRPAASDAPRFTAGGKVGTKVSVLADHPTHRQYRGNVRDRASKQLELSPIWVQLKSQSPDGKHPQQTFANTESHIMRTGTANTSPMHQTALSYETAVSDGGRLELNTRGTRKPVLFTAQESPDDMSDPDSGIRKRTRTLG